jgi:hypothetical protein
VATDLLARIRTELEQRMAELRPLLSEHERLTAAADTLTAADAQDVSPDASSAPTPGPRASGARPTPPRRRARERVELGPRRRGAGASERAASAPSAAAQTREHAASAPPPKADERAESESYGEEDERKRRPSPGAVQQAILAALEHGSHTVSELVMVTAMRGADIRANLTRLAKRGKVAKVKREGDGKTAYALS